MSLASFTTRLEKIDSELWQYLIRVPDGVAAPFVSGSDRRVICTIKGLPPFHCALMHDGSGGFFILLNQQRRKALGLVLGEAVEAALEKDTSDFGMPMSDEFREVLSQDDEARNIFLALTAGKQRTLIYWADSVKSPDIKIRRALVLMDHLRQTQGGLDYRVLNAQLKEANRLAKLR